MSSRSSFLRKIGYLVAIAVLLMPLFWLGQPATNAVQGVQGSPGGKLAQLRKEYHLSQAELGQVDPTSVTIKLATLGMRGIAANILWEKANEFKMKKDWTNLGATLNQIIKVQPNFINVWINQAWNLSYNVSVEFDDFRERYRWVIKGIDFLKKGIGYNDREPRLLWDVGWFTSHKIGRSDEQKQFRKLFKEDDDFHGSRPLALRDNWLVGKQWFEWAVKKVETLGVSMMGKTPLLYRSNGPMCQMNYAEDQEKDGTFGPVAKAAWQRAASEWHRYGTEELPTSFRNEETQKPIVVRLNDLEMHEEAAKKLASQLDAMEPGLREKLVEQRRAALTGAQRKALETPLGERTGKQFELAAQAEQAIHVTDNDVARKITGPRRKEALQLAKEAMKQQQMARYISGYRNIVNFVYWRLRAEAEQTDDMIDARRLVYLGDREYSEGDLVAARDAYQQGLNAWRAALDKYPSFVNDQTTDEDLMEVIRRYRNILKQLDEPFPKPFILQDVIDANRERQGGSAEQDL